MSGCGGACSHSRVCDCIASAVLRRFEECVNTDVITLIVMIVITLA
jgi:hypothetical protein